MNPVTRFWTKVDRGSEAECWPWGAFTYHGYGMFWDGAKTVRAHRFSYEVTRGPIPEGKQLDHLCRKRDCVNPWHLEAVTQKENILRGFAPSALNAAKTICKRGHPLDEANTRVYKGRNGGVTRHCKACTKLRSRASDRETP